MGQLFDLVGQGGGDGQCVVSSRVLDVDGLVGTHGQAVAQGFGGFVATDGDGGHFAAILFFDLCGRFHGNTC